MKYKVTLNNRTYEVEVEAGEAMLIDEYEAYAPAAPAPVVAAAPAAAAEQDDDEDDDPQAAAAAAPVVIAAPHYEYLLIMKVLRGLFAALDTIIWPGREIGAFRL